MSLLLTSGLWVTYDSSIPHNFILFRPENYLVHVLLMELTEMKMGSRNAWSFLRHILWCIIASTHMLLTKASHMTKPKVKGQRNKLPIMRPRQRCDAERGEKLEHWFNLTRALPIPIPSLLSTQIHTSQKMGLLEFIWYGIMLNKFLAYSNISFSICN